MSLDKLVDSTQLNSDLTSVANAIRAKGGTSDSLAFPSGFVTAIGNIPTGGSDVWESLIDFSKTINLKNDTSFDSKTPSTTAQEIYASVNGVKDSGGTMIETAAVDFSTYSYVGLTVQIVDFAWLSTPSNTGVPSKNFSISLMHPNDYLRNIYTTWSVSNAFCLQKSNSSYQARNQGVPAGGLGWGTNSTTATSPKFRLQISKINVQANATNFPVADVQKIDSANTNITCIWKLFRAPKKVIDQTLYNLCRYYIYGTPIPTT